MEEIKETLNKFAVTCFILTIPSAVTFLLVIGVLIIENDIITSLHDLKKDVSVVVQDVRVNENQYKNLLDDYKKLKTENEILLDKIQSYKEME